MPKSMKSVTKLLKWPFGGIWYGHAPWNSLPVDACVAPPAAAASVGWLAWFELALLAAVGWFEPALVSAVGWLAWFELAPAPVVGWPLVAGASGALPPQEDKSS